MQALCEDYLPKLIRQLLDDLDDKPDWFDDLLKEHTSLWCRCLSHKIKNISTSQEMVLFLFIFIPCKY